MENVKLHNLFIIGGVGWFCTDLSFGPHEDQGPDFEKPSPGLCGLLT